jgi:hypothetical protein
MRETAVAASLKIIVSHGPRARSKLVFDNLVYLRRRKDDFRALHGKHLEGLDFRGFWYTD